jgi:hypothetical protein
VLLAFAADYDRDVSPRSRNGPAYDTDGFSGGIATWCSTLLEQLHGTTHGIGDERYDNELISLVNAVAPLVFGPGR